MIVEILMATYNGEKYIAEQIDSIINQTYKNWKLLIRDDGSKDKTLEIIEEYEKKDNRIKVIKDNKGNLGFVKNFEELVKNSKEEYVMFSDQDDYWLENKIEIYVKELNKLSKEILEKPLLLHSNSFVCDEKLRILKSEFINSRVASKYETNNYFFSYIVQGSTTLINRKVINIGVPFFENVTLHDRYFHLLVEFFGKRIFINKSLLKYRQHLSNQIGAKSNIIRKILNKRYFEEEERNLVLEIKKIYEIEEEKNELIYKYLEVTDRKKSRITRFLKSFVFGMNLKKRVFIFLKG